MIKYRQIYLYYYFNSSILGDYRAAEAMYERALEMVYLSYLYVTLKIYC